MFGCTKSLRNWSSEAGNKSTATPTHVSVYDAQKNGSSMLDREGMILAALLSGGDYSPDGLPGFGIKVACEAARAGYGKSLCRLKTADKTGFQEWREKLAHDLKTNEHKHFQRKHPGLKIPSDWPNLEVLRYYTHPVVSPLSVMDTVRPKLDSPGLVKLEYLREFAREEFGWDFRIGALKFIRVIATAVLSTKLQNEGRDVHDLVKRISSRREHFNADGEPELRLSYVPAEVVPIDLSQEVDEIIPQSRDALAVNGENEDVVPDVDEPLSSQPKLFDPTKPEAAWVAEEFVTQTAPSLVAAWKEAESVKARKKLPKKTQGTGKKSSKDKGLVQGALDAHFKVVKPTSSATAGQSSKTSESVIPGVKSSNIPLSSVTQHHSAHATGMRQLSKPPTPTKTKDQSGISYLDTFDSSPVTPHRTRYTTTKAEAILISSSPPGPASPSPLPSSYDPRTRSFRGTKIPDDVRAITHESAAPQSVREMRKPKTREAAKENSHPAKALLKVKQTSITMFATQRTSRESHTMTQQDAPAGMPSTPPLELDESYSDDSSMVFPPMSELASGPPPLASPKSPNKRRKNPVDSRRDTSPTRASKSKKTLLVPDENGFVRVVRVDDDKRDELEANETKRLARKGGQQKPIRQSDVSFIDLTE